LGTFLEVRVVLMKNQLFNFKIEPIKPKKEKSPQKKCDFPDVLASYRLYHS
jgi:hypothetical protein